jgi:hypothetical protein
MTNVLETGDDIRQRQNEDSSLKLLAAQRQIYCDEKLLFGVQLALASTNALVGAVIALLPGTNLLVIGSGLIVTILNEALAFATGDQQKQAARIQEQFDCYVLGLPPNPLHTGDPEPPETIAKASGRYDPAKAPPLPDWYVGNLQKLTLTAARILCQRTNCSYDIGLRERYGRALWIAFGVSLVIVTLIGTVGGMTVFDWLSKLVGPLLPALCLILKHNRANSESITRLTELRTHADQLWNQCQSQSLSENELLERSRRLQDQLFDHRSRSLLQFEWLYKLSRPSVESFVTASADSMIEEYLRRNTINK